MLKALAIFAVLLVVGQAGAPSPRVTTDPKGGSTAGKNGESQTDRQPPRPATIASEQPARNSGNDANAPKDGKDGWDKAAVLADYLLVIVGLGGIIAALRTLGKLERQTKATENQVKVSHDALRAWIGIDVRENIFPSTLGLSMTDQARAIMTVRPPRFEWEIKNYGQSPAFLKTVEVSNFAYSTPTEKLEHGSPLEVNGFLGAGQSDTHILTLPDNGLSKCVAGQMFWRVSFKVVYDDAFGKEHETMFSFHYFVKQETKDPRRTGFYQDIDKSTNYYN
jgi:hypothetical protein